MIDHITLTYPLYQSAIDTCFKLIKQVIQSNNYDDSLQHILGSNSIVALKQHCFFHAINRHK